MCAATVAVVAAGATDMEGKSKTVATVRTSFAWTAEVTCDDTKGWSFGVTGETDGGRDVVVVKLTAESERALPAFGVFFRVPGAGVQNVWTSDCGTSGDGRHLWPKLWWKWNGTYTSELAKETPIAVGFNSAGISHAAIACSEAFEFLKFGLYADDETCDIIGRCEFFSKYATPRKEYVAKILFDRRGLSWHEVVRESSEWIQKVNGFKPASVPESAYDPLYSTWYAYLQDVYAGELEKEATLAASFGMKTMILDDGWQKLESATFYSAVGDWMPVKARFPDMKAHVAKVHAAGVKYMLWLAVPHMGDESAAWKSFEGKFLHGGEGRSPGRCAVLDPRFPEVREYLIRTYERVVREWGFDGVKLDFIDAFQMPAPDPAVAEGYAGRDFRSLPDAVDRLMKDVSARLRKINPDVLVEFRQHYMGPAILQYGNMMRCADCPADPCANRRRICDLRLTSGRAAVHSDMLVWSKDETPEGAALPILNALYSTIQYSMILSKIKPAHADVIRRWLAFSQAHRDALLKGAFRPHHPENGYTSIEGESATERILTAYADDVVLDCGAADKKVILVNATGSDGLYVNLPAVPQSIRMFDVLGREVSATLPSVGLVRLQVPASGHVEFRW